MRRDRGAEARVAGAFARCVLIGEDKADFGEVGKFGLPVQWPERFDSLEPLCSFEFHLMIEVQH